MRYKSLLVSFLSLGVCGAITPIASATLSFDPIGPYDAGTGDITITGRVSTARTMRGVRERLEVGRSEDNYNYVYTTASHNCSMAGTDVSFVVPLKSFCNGDGFYGRATVFNASLTMAIYKFKFKPRVKKTIDVKNYIKTPYVTEDIIVDIDSYENSHIESFQFTSFIDYFDVDYYFKIDLDNFYVDVNCFAGFGGGTAILRFLDYYNVFEYLGNPHSDVQVDIPITLRYENSRIYFDFPSVMYVDKTTLQMSLQAKPGFVATHKFYLPKNKLKYFLDRHFDLIVKDFGYAKISFTYPIYYLCDRNLLGDCDDSDYCVVGEV